jgi:protein SCO1/2
MFTLIACSPPTREYRGTEISGVDWGSDFELTAQDGRRVNTRDFRGKVVLLYFGYTHCPDICIPSLARLADAYRKLGPLGEKVQVLFITVDPLRDTPQRLADFIPRFDRHFIGLTGSAAEVAAVVRDYKVAYDPKTSLRQVSDMKAMTMPLRDPIEHAGGMFVRDVEGRLRLYLQEGMAADDIAHDVRVLLGQSRIR